MPNHPLNVLRAATSKDIPALVTIWHAGWHEAHAHILPPELVTLRTEASLAERFPALLPHTTVAAIDGHPVGFCTVEKDELYQLYVGSGGRGRGVAAALVADAEARFLAHGLKRAWLACAIGNDRAGRFYEKCGWTRVGNMLNPAYTPTGPYELETWRYEKLLSRT